MTAGSMYSGHKASVIRPVVCALLILAGSASTGLCADAGGGTRPDMRGRKIFYLDSYDATYLPSTLSQKGAREVLAPAGVVMEVFYLDEKRNPSEAALREAALKVRRRIEEWKPDLIISMDDPANNLVIVPWYRGGELPVVFAGVNWDAAPYGYPARNVTGQVEVELIRELFAELKKYARGGRIGFLTGDTSTDRINLAYYETILGIKFDRKYLVGRFDEWKSAYLALQKEVDMLFFRNNGGIDNWNDAEAEKLIMERSLIPSGTASSSMGRWVLLNFAKVREEFGEYSARTALRILGGESPAAIPLTANRQAKAIVNMRLAKALGIRFPIEFLERATFVEEGESMNITRTLAFRLMIFMGGAFVLTSVAAFLLLDAQVKRVVDRSQSEVYGEKLEGVSRLLETRVRRLEATGMPEAYAEDFKASTLKTLRDLYYQAGAGGGFLLVLDRSGAVLLHPILSRGDASLADTELVRRVRVAGEGEFDYRNNGSENRWVIFRSFPAWDWILVYSIPWEEKYSDRTELHRELIRVMPVITAVVLVLLFAIVAFFTRPIARLTRAATIMAGGDLDYPVTAGRTGGTGEVGLLATAFVRLRDSIRERIAELRQSNEDLRREINQREKAEEDLQESSERLRSTLASLDDLVFSLDREHRFTDFQQPGKLQALYLPPEHFIGRRVSEIAFPEDARDIWIKALQTLETRPEVQSFDYHLTMPWGETWYSAKASRRLDSRGQFAGVTVVVRDITERKIAEHELERQNVELRKLDRMKDDLVRNVSHELKTPVAKQAMQLEILHSFLDTGAPRPRIDAVLSVMDASVNRQRQVIHSLLDLARLESGRREMSLSPVRLDEAMAEIIAEFQALTERVGMTVTLKAQPVTIRGDWESLWHVFSNLFSNALKFRRPGGGGSIEVEVSLQAGGARVVVADDGQGMDPRECERAFEKFYQASATVEGSGVGLTIAREMTERLGGRISIRSAGRGRGTEVTVILPLDSEAHP